MSRLLGYSFSLEDDEVISIKEVKDHLYIDYENMSFDTVLSRITKEVRGYVEDVTCLSLVPRTVQCSFIYEKQFTIPFAPLVDFVSCEIMDGDTWVMQDAADYVLDYNLFKSLTGGKIRLTYTAGHDILPQGLKLGIMNEIAARFENRGDGSMVQLTNILQSYKMLEWVI